VSAERRNEFAHVVYRWHLKALILCAIVVACTLALEASAVSGLILPCTVGLLVAGVLVVLDISRIIVERECR
jgi:Zn-dependent protease with chaperone function